ncbi:MAG: hypothetical protein ACE5NA_07480 [Nitrospiraceae bacterium]
MSSVQRWLLPDDWLASSRCPCLGATGHVTIIIAYGPWSYDDLRGTRLVLARHLPEKPKHADDLRRCSRIRETLVRDGLFDAASHNLTDHNGGDSGDAAGVATRWRIGLAPFSLTREQVSFFEALGAHLLAFYRALNRLYFESLRGTQPAWVAAYLDQGKPDSLIALSRMKRFRDTLPLVIRPDVLPTEHGMAISELDSVPGGIGLTGSLSRAYGAEADDTPEQHEIVGGPDGLVIGFEAMLRHLLGAREGAIAIVVSDEANAYRPEMSWLAARLRERGLDVSCVHPRDIQFTEDALLLSDEQGQRPIAALYRFFELFDLKNVPKSELVMYSAKKDRTLVTPPFKPALEEKLAFALFHHEVLRPFWQQALGEDTDALLSRLIPRTWILDPRPVPPFATIPGLRVAGRGVSDWRELAHASQKDRRFVVKPSGFSELAWGSRGVSVGHDLAQPDWAAALEAALAAFPMTPSILQEYHKGRQFQLSYYDEHTDRVTPMMGRARLSPYYFVTGDRATLAGVLATVCPPDKKVIHGMRDAVMVPCAVASARLND